MSRSTVLDLEITKSSCLLFSDPKTERKKERRKSESKQENASVRNKWELFAYEIEEHWWFEILSLFSKRMESPLILIGICLEGKEKRRRVCEDGEELARVYRNLNLWGSNGHMTVGGACCVFLS